MNGINGSLNDSGWMMSSSGWKRISYK